MASFQYGGIIETIVSTVTAAGTTTLTNVSAQIQVFTGSTTQTVVLPNATTYTQPGAKFEIVNESSGALTLQFNGGAAFTDAAGVSYTTVTPHTTLIVKLQTNGTSAGTWLVSSVQGVAILPTIANNTVLGNVSGGSATAGAITLAQVATNFPANSIPEAKLSNIANNTVLANVSGGTAAVVATTLASLVSNFPNGSITGAMLATTAISVLRIDQITSSQTVTAPFQANYALILGCGGGGGGGGNVGNTQYSGGGGAGRWDSFAVFTGFGSSFAVTIGAGGAGGAADGSNGAPGGVTTVGPYNFAPGGPGGGDAWIVNGGAGGGAIGSIGGSPGGVNNFVGAGAPGHNQSVGSNQGAGPSATGGGGQGGAAGGGGFGGGSGIVFIVWFGNVP